MNVRCDTRGNDIPLAGLNEIVGNVEITVEGSELCQIHLGGVVDAHHPLGSALILDVAVIQLTAAVSQLLYK